VTSRIPNARDSIATIWEALVPPSDPLVRYRQARTLERLEGVLSRRAFFFGAPSGGEHSECGGSFALIDVSFNAFVRLDLTGRDLDDSFNDVANEAVLLTNTINFFNGNLGVGVRYVRALGWSVQPSKDQADLDIVIRLIAKVEETDGAQ